MALKIIGAGIAGLLAANMLRRYDPVVVEAKEKLPNNHSAVLRFRSRVVADTLGIDFRKVSVIKATLPYKNPVADALSYSYKNTGVFRSDRSITDSVSYAERYVAPPDLLSRMAEGVDVRYGQEYSFDDADRVISTIPMPNLMAALDYAPYREGRIDFGWVGGVNVRARIVDCDAYVSVYVPDPSFPFSRVSVTGDELIVEMPNQGLAGVDPHHTANAAAHLILGIRPYMVEDVKVYEQPYAKIVPIDEDERREFMFWASTIRRRSFSLGRFATWRPSLLADDLVKDVKVIERLMNSRSSGYDAEKLEREAGR